MISGSIEFACPFCEKVTRVPATFAGKQGKCPGCQKVIEVPTPDVAGAQTTVDERPPDAGDTAVYGAEAAPPVFEYRHGAPPPAGGVAIGGPVVVDGDDDRRPCPSCGEPIKVAAKKCKFCGEFLDPSLRAQRRAPALEVGRLASPWVRLAAAFIDNVLVGVPAGVLGVAGIFMIDQRMEAAGLVLMLLALLVHVLYHVYSWYLIATTGQNIPKRWLGIKIVRVDGAPVDFVSGVVLRNWVYALVTLVPYLGACIWWAGFLFILAEDRRCLHDHIASTMVVEV